MTAQWKEALVFGLLYSTEQESGVRSDMISIDFIRVHLNFFFGSSMMPTWIRFPHQPKKLYSGLTNSIFNKKR